MSRFIAYIVRSSIAISFLYIVFSPVFAHADVTAIPRQQSCELYATRTTSYGQRGFDVEKLQMFLNAYENAQLPVTGYFGPMTRAAVKNFQGKYAITADISGSQSVQTSSVINALYCRPDGNVVTGFVSIVPVSKGIPTGSLTGIVVPNITDTMARGYVSTHPSSHSQGTTKPHSATIATTTTTKIASPSTSTRTTPVTVSPVNENATSELNTDVSDTQSGISIHDLIPWLMLLAALFLAYLAWRTYQRERQEQAQRDHVSATPVIVPPVKHAIPVIVPEQTSALTQNDDLTKLAGVGPAANKVLKAAGIVNFKTLAAMQSEDLKAIFKKAWPHFNEPSISTWAEQAKLASEGKWDELAQFVKELSNNPSKQK